MPLQRDDSRISSSSRPLSASSSRPRSVIDFMRSPGGSINSSPRRTLSKASKASTLDSRHAGSIFSGEYASTAQTSIMSQDSHGSPYKRPVSSTARPPSSAPSSAPGHVRQNSEGSRYFRATSAEPQHMPFSSAQPEVSARSPARPQSAMAASRPDEPEDSLNLSTDDAYDPNALALARSRSDGSLYKSSSAQSLPRSRSGTVSRSASTQSMRIEEEVEEEVEEEEEEEEEEEILHCELNQGLCIVIRWLNPPDPYQLCRRARQSALCRRECNEAGPSADLWVLDNLAQDHRRLVRSLFLSSESYRTVSRHVRHHRLMMILSCRCRIERSETTKVKSTMTILSHRNEHCGNYKMGLPKSTTELPPQIRMNGMGFLLVEQQR